MSELTENHAHADTDALIDALEWWHGSKGLLWQRLSNEDWEHLSRCFAAARAYADLLENGRQVDWCEEHRAEEAVEEEPGICWAYAGQEPCRIVSKLLTEVPE
jgi:hypothetical protein